jgi:hypothetical protein
VSRRALTVLTLALLVGSVAAFTYAERLKLDRGPLGRGRVSHAVLPGCDCRRETARIRFVLHRAERLDVDVVNADGEVVQTLLADARRPKGRVVITWDGRDGRSEGGAAAPEGDYRVRVRLLDEDRTIMLPGHVTVRAPAGQAAPAAPRGRPPRGRARTT